MVEQGIWTRPEYEERVIDFCIENNIEWGVVYSESLVCGVIGTGKEIIKVGNYRDKLELERIEFRKTKSFWWRICN